MNELPEGLPRWVHVVMVCDKLGSSWYVGCGFLFAPVLAVVSPWPAISVAVWVVISVFGLWLGLLGIAMAVGASIVMQSNADIPDTYWQKLFS